MKTFMMNAEDRITVLEQGQELPEGSEGFETEQQLAAITAASPAGRLVAIWNHLSGVKPVKRFTDRRTAVQRIWKVVQRLEPSETGSSGNKDRSAKQLGSKPQVRLYFLLPA